MDKGHEKNVHSQNGVGFIEEGTDITYEIEVIDCDDKPEQAAPGLVTSQLVSNRCLFFTLTGIGRNLALTANFTDKYHPANTGIYDVYADFWTGTGSTNKAQQWYWNETDHTLHSLAFKDKALFEGTSGIFNNMFVFSIVQGRGE